MRRRRPGMVYGSGARGRRSAAANRQRRRRSGRVGRLERSRRGVDGVEIGQAGRRRRIDGSQAAMGEAAGAVPRIAIVWARESDGIEGAGPGIDGRREIVAVMLVAGVTVRVAMVAAVSAAGLDLAAEGAVSVGLRAGMTVVRVGVIVAGQAVVERDVQAGDQLEAEHPQRHRRAGQQAPPAVPGATHAGSTRTGVADGRHSTQGHTPARPDWIARNRRAGRSRAPGLGGAVVSPACGLSRPRG